MLAMLSGCELRLLYINTNNELPFCELILGQLMYVDVGWILFLLTDEPQTSNNI